ncbi:MAG: hypothetical protein RJA57_1518 [Bacteroidota bacterium]
MRTILQFGAGKSATVLIDYLLRHAAQENWRLVLVDADHRLAASKLAHSSHGEAVSFDIRDEESRTDWIRQADIVISLLPPALHQVVAEDCLRFGKNLLTASYVDPSIRKMGPELERKGLLFLCEMGLDPGIDHMSALALIRKVRGEGDRITSFLSHCGGLVAPESDDNPWHYKISWNPRNVVLAGKAGARYRERGQSIDLPYPELFRDDRHVDIPGVGALGWYPNRDSLSYIPLYGLETADTFIRTTLRHPDFLFGWNHIVSLHLTDETPVYDTDGKSLQTLFREHLERHGFGEWLGQQLKNSLSEGKGLLENLIKLADAEQQARQQGNDLPSSFLTADPKGNLQEVEMDAVKKQAAQYLAHRMHRTNLILKQLFFLGLNDDETLVNRGRCSAADLLQFALERKLTLRPYDRDMIVMLHEIGHEHQGTQRISRSTLVVKGENGLHTAMARTVGLPLGIAARLILNGRIQCTGVRLPLLPEIYEPVLAELAENGVRFTESTATNGAGS